MRSPSLGGEQHHSNDCTISWTLCRPLGELLVAEYGVFCSRSSFVTLWTYVVLFWYTLHVLVIANNHMASEDPIIILRLESLRLTKQAYEITLQGYRVPVLVWALYK